jgi:SAM-dependent methyltransferase
VAPASSLTAREVALALYYDRLTRWLEVARWFGRGGGIEHLTAHRAVFDERLGRPCPARLHDEIAAALALPAEPRGLDAGCGPGGTLLALQRRFGGSWLGLTLSPAQARRATAAARARGVGASCRFAVASYDAPPAGLFDAIVAVESLAHSADPAASVAALARRLAPGGTFVVVDDRPEPAARDDRDFAAFRAGWRVPAPLDRAGWTEALAAAGLALERERDLTAGLRPRGLDEIDRLDRLAWVARAAAPFPALRAVLDSHRGGLALERLYRRGLMRYVLLVARRTTDQPKRA